MIENILKGRVEQVHWTDLQGTLESGFLEKNGVLLDVRTWEEYEDGHVEGAVHIPIDELRERLEELPKEKRIYVSCQSGLRSYLACRILQQQGFSCYNMAGGYGFYAGLYKDRCMVRKGPATCGKER